MYLAVNVKDPNEFHSFEWTEKDELIICGVSVNPDEWRIMEVMQIIDEY